jgi:hypothetical protein
MMNKEVETTSPFICGKMIKDPRSFWGRKEEAFNIISLLKNLESVSILGDRRIGKTSLAYYIFSTKNKNFDASYEFIWLDGQSNHMNSINNFFTEISSKSSLDYSSGNDNQSCRIHFEDAVKKSCKKIIVFINEFELLTHSTRQREFDDSFFNTLRLLAEQEDFALLTTSNKPLVDLCKHIIPVSSPFYNIFTDIHLSEFSDEEVSGFLDISHEGVVLTEPEKIFIKSIPKRNHPLRLQVACHHVYINRDLHLSNKNVRRQIVRKTNALMNHSKVQKERDMTKNNNNTNKDKISGLIAAVVIPILSIAMFLGVFTYALQYLTNFQAVLVSLLSSIIGFATMLFAGRFVGVVKEETFYKLFGKIINQIPLLTRESKKEKNKNGE